MTDDLISVPEIASLHSRHKSAVHKIIGRLGIETHSIKREESRGQKVTYISRNDYALLAEALQSTRIMDEDSDVTTELHGAFYVIQLEPIHDAGRVKLGFISDVGARIRSHRTSAPFARLLKHWPCKLLWEKTAIDCISFDCQKLHTEVFRTTDIEALVQRADEFFGLMPKLE